MPSAKCAAQLSACGGSIALASISLPLLRAIARSRADHGEREHICWYRPHGQCGPDREGALRAHRRPLCVAAAARYAAHGRCAWFFSHMGDPIRALAVLVASTPCPLILAAPVAFIAGVAQGADRGILIKGSGPLEALARRTR